MLENIRKNFKPLAGAIIISVVLWFMVATEKQYTHQIRVPIELVRLAPGKILADTIPESALIEVRGAGTSLIGTFFYDVKFNLELPELDKSTSIQLKDYVNFLDLPATFNIEVLEILEPTTLRLDVDNEVTVLRPVLLSGSIGTEDGYVFLEYEMQPESVQVHGPKKLVNKMTHVFTKPQELAGNKSKFTQEIELEELMPGLVDISPRRINVLFDIQRLVEREVYPVPISIMNIPRGLLVEAIPEKLSLRIKGGENLVAAVKPQDIRAEIDFAKNYNSERDNYAARIVTPENIIWLESIPKTFRLKVKRK